MYSFNIVEEKIKENIEKKHDYKMKLYKYEDENILNNILVQYRYYAILQGDPNTNGEYNFFQTMSKYFKTVVDIGARDDVYYIEKANNDTHLYLFEPNPVFFASLQKNIEKIENINEKRNNIHLYNAGCSDKQSVLQYYDRAESFVNRFSETSTREFPVIRLDTLEELNSVKFIDFLKIDTEGFELDVLRGCEKIIDKIQIIQFEYGGTYPDRNISLSDVISYLNTHGYHHFYYLAKEHLVEIDTVNLIEHNEYSNIITARFSLCV